MTSSRSPGSCRIAKITTGPGVSLLGDVEGGGGEEHREMVLKRRRSYRNGQNSVLFLTQSSEPLDSILNRKPLLSLREEKEEKKN